MNLRVGIVDGGVGQLPAAASLFVVDDDGVTGRASAHGAMVAALILAAAPGVTLLDACVATATQRPTPRRVADAVHWCIETGARLINLSLGLAEDREPLRAACARATAAGVVLVAAAPARGAAVFPASYPGVLAVCGDARCADGDWSLLAGGYDAASFCRSGLGPTPVSAFIPQGDFLRGDSAACRAKARPTVPGTPGGGQFGTAAVFGACPQALAGCSGGGASAAAARLSGIVARYLLAEPQAGRDAVLAFLAAQAARRGRERRMVPA